MIIYTGQGIKKCSGIKTIPKKSKNDVYMILYVNNVIYHVIYIYILYIIYIIVSCVERKRERERKKNDIHTYKKISKYREKKHTHTYIYRRSASPQSRMTITVFTGNAVF
jgi:hypothetical protein